jgi:hypothetical protein
LCLGLQFCHHHLQHKTGVKGGVLVFRQPVAAGEKKLLLDLLLWFQVNNGH